MSIRLSREYLASILRQSDGCFEQDGTPTDPYTLCASHAMMMPYEDITPVVRQSFKRAVHEAMYHPQQRQTA